LFFCSTVSRRWLAGFIVLSGFMLLMVYQVLPGYILYDKPHKNDFAKVVIDRNLQQISEISDNDQEYYVENYLSKRVEKFVATLGASPKATTWYNDMHTPPNVGLVLMRFRQNGLLVPRAILLPTIKFGTKDQKFSGGYWWSFYTLE